MRDSAFIRLKIVQTGEPVLRQVARQVLRDEIARDETQRLIEAMRDTMRDAPGVGLAAPQVGVPLQIAVNPELVPDEGDPVEFYEGCLSVPGFTAIVPRARSVTVRCLDENGQEKSLRAQGWYARILQHEIDHLHGKLYLDRMITRSYATIDNFNRHWKALPIPEVRSALAASELDRS
jgi:peptide deformylase